MIARAHGVANMKFKRLALYGSLLSTSLFSHSLLAIEKLNISGFATIAATKSDTRYVTDNTIDDDWDFYPDSVIGLQFDSDINASTTFTLQMIMRGDNTHSAGSNDRFEPDIEWAYITTQISEKSSLQIGRMRNSAFMLSESLEVGYTYPWVRPPVDVYSRVPSTIFEGIKYHYKHFYDNDWEMSFDTFWGVEQNEGPITTNHHRGFDVSFSNELHNIRLGHQQINLSIFATDFLNRVPPVNSGPPEQTSIGIAEYTAQFLIPTISANVPGSIPVDQRFLSSFSSQDLRVKQTGLGYVFDDGQMLFMSELTRTDAEGAFVPDFDAAYLTFGYRFGSIMPHITYNYAKTTDDKERDFSRFNHPFIPGVNTVYSALDDLDRDRTVSVNERGSYLRNNNMERQGITLGLRWDYDKRSAFKFDVQYLGEFNGSNGFFEGQRDASDKSVLIYRMAITTVF